MKQVPSERKLPPAAAEELTTQYYRVQPIASAQRLWDRVLSPADRRKLGGNLLNAWRTLGTAGMWAKLHRTSNARAVLEVAVRIGHMSQTNYDWLMRALLGKRASKPKPSAKPKLAVENKSRAKPDAPAKPPCPSWNKETGELRYNGHLIRKVRITAKATNIQRILDAFEEEKWPRRIDDPLPGGADRHRVHLTLQSLNKGLKKVRFQSQEGGLAICWSPR